VSSAVYVDDLKLAELWPERSVGWSVNGEYRSVRIGSTTYKRLFGAPDEVEEFREECLRQGIKRAPSGWADVYHARYGMQFANKSYLAISPPAVYGPWEERRLSGIKEVHRQYDLVSAYAWAGMCAALPEHRSARPVRGAYRWPMPGQTGLWLGCWYTSGALLPPHLRNAEAKEVWVSSEEIERLALTPRFVRYGIIFDRSGETIRRQLEETREKFPKWWKRIGRAYWGAYAARQGPEQSTPSGGVVNILPNPFREPALAHFIESRIRLRLAEVARDAALLYVDAVVTAAALRHGAEVGDWKLVPLGKSAHRAFGPLTRAP
jgi:hypothetical protein